MRRTTILRTLLGVFLYRTAGAFSSLNRAFRTVLNYQDGGAVYEERFAIEPPSQSLNVAEARIKPRRNIWQSNELRNTAIVVAATVVAPLLDSNDWFVLGGGVNLLALGAVGALPLILRPIPHRHRFDIQDASIRKYGSNHHVMGDMGLATLTSSIAEEVMFRFYLYHAFELLTGSSVAAMFAQAVIYAPHKNDEGLLAGLWYSFLTVCTGSIFPAIVAHSLVDWHRQAVIHQEAITQLDYIADCDPESPIQRLFCAFDSQHKGALSRHDVERALAYAQLPPASNVGIVTNYEDFESLLKQQHKVMRN